MGKYNQFMADALHITLFCLAFGLADVSVYDESGPRITSETSPIGRRSLGAGLSAG